MSRTKYMATLANGETATRSSERTYTHHWHVTGISTKPQWNGKQWITSGWAASLNNAHKAAASAAGNFRRCDMRDITTEIVEARTK